MAFKRQRGSSRVAVTYSSSLTAESSARRQQRPVPCRHHASLTPDTPLRALPGLIAPSPPGLRLVRHHAFRHPGFVRYAQAHSSGVHSSGVGYGLIRPVFDGGSFSPHTHSSGVGYDFLSASNIIPIIGSRAAGGPSNTTSYWTPSLVVILVPSLRRYLTRGVCDGGGYPGAIAQKVPHWWWWWWW